MSPAKEYDLLRLLVANKGRVLAYAQIYQKVWKEDAFGNANNAIACHVHNLRDRQVIAGGLFCYPVCTGGWLLYSYNTRCAVYIWYSSNY